MTLQLAPAPTSIAPRTLRSSDVVTPLNEALGAQIKLHFMKWSTSLFGEGMSIDEAQNGTLVPVARGVARRLAPTSPILTLAESQQQIDAAGLHGVVQPSEGERRDALNIKIKTELEKKRLGGIIARADQGFGTQALLGVTGFAVDFADPVNLATIAVPGIAELKAGYWALKGAALVGSSVPKFAARAGLGAIEGALGAAVVEPINYAAHRSVGDDYDLVDSLMNIGLGATAGSTLRALGGTGVDLFRGLRLRWDVGVDDFRRVFNDGLERIGQNRLLREPELAIDFRGMPEQSMVVMPGRGSAGDRVNIDDELNTKDVLQDYQPFHTPDGKQIYRVPSNGEVVVYTHSPAAGRGARDTITLHRLRSEDPEFDLPLSEKRLQPAERDGRLIYMKPPKDMMPIDSNAIDTTLHGIRKLSVKGLLKFQPPKGRGYRVKNAIGLRVHSARNEYARTRKSLHTTKRIYGRNGQFRNPDHPELYGGLIDSKPDTMSGRKSGATQAGDYRKILDRETAILLYPFTRKQLGEVGEMEARVVGAWKISEKEHEVTDFLAPIAGAAVTRYDTKQEQNDEDRQ